MTEPYFYKTSDVSRDSASSKRPFHRFLLIFLLAAAFCSAGCGAGSGSDHSGPSVTEQQRRQIEQLTHQLGELQRQLEEERAKKDDTQKQVEAAHKEIHWSKNIIVFTVIAGFLGFLIGISLGTMTKKDAEKTSNKQNHQSEDKQNER